MILKDLHKDWTIINSQYLHRRLNFDTYAKTLNCVAQIGALAEQHNHHPVFEVGWGYVEVRVWSHDVNAITQRDYRLAQAIDDLS